MDSTYHIKWLSSLRLRIQMIGDVPLQKGGRIRAALFFICASRISSGWQNLSISLAATRATHGTNPGRLHYRESYFYGVHSSIRKSSRKDMGPGAHATVGKRHFPLPYTNTCMITGIEVSKFQVCTACRTRYSVQVFAEEPRESPFATWIRKWVDHVNALWRP